MENKLALFGGVGAGLATLCCFTPLAVIALGALGLAGLTAYLDLVLLPLLMLCLALLAFGLYRSKRAGNRKTCERQKQNLEG